MDTETPGAIDQSFDIVARQDQLDSEVATLRSDVDEVKARVDRIGRAASRPVIGGTDSPEVKGFVDGYLRRGSTSEIKSISGAVPSDGGYAVPQEIDALIARTLTEISPIRAIAQVVQTGTSGYRKLVSLGGTASGWVSETAARPETDTPQFSEIAPPTGELYANPAASQAMRCWLQSSREWLSFDADWIALGKPVLASGGATVDTESRSAIQALINALTEAGIFST